ncbi:NAD(P)-binding protein [Ramaria rubella]|nr:NAD(P)-binding protein [Ramaria rubella]
MELERSNLNVIGDIVADYIAPPFLCALWAAASGYIRATNSPQVASPAITPDLYLQKIVESGTTLGFLVPSFLKAWASDSDSVQTIKKLKGILWGGGPLHPEIGASLCREGVTLWQVAGATEYGFITCVGDAPAEGYEYFRFLPEISSTFLPEEGLPGVYELVVKDDERHHIAVVNTELDGVPAYSTNDLLEQHPNNPELFRIVGRKDDQIILSNGEKGHSVKYLPNLANQNPNIATAENIISMNPHVKTVLMFGRGYPSNGILIDPTSHEEAEKLGPVSNAQTTMPPHTRGFQRSRCSFSVILIYTQRLPFERGIQAIILASPTKPFTYTAKGTPRKGAILVEYDSEIKAMYQAIQHSSQTDIPIPLGSSREGGWTPEENLVFVREVVRNVMTRAKDMGDDDDIFRCGCDSLQETYIRNTILHALRKVTPTGNVGKVPLSFVYQHPTVRALAVFSGQVSRHESNVAIDLEPERRKRLQDFVARYTQNWPVHQPSEANPMDERILLTGSTGGPGSQLLVQLITMPSVSRMTSRERHLEAFRDRGNDLTLLNSKKVIFVEGDTAVDGFNVKPDLFDEIRNSVTTIIHTAWQVDFNLSLMSFESAIGGVRRMIDLALKSPHATPPSIMFTSSVGTVKPSADIPPVAEGPVTDLALVDASGYGESKWVSERILWTGGQATALQPVVVRVGQLSGGPNGSWNVKEWFPALISASQVVGGLPENAGLVSFLPIHVAASTLIELRHTSNQFAHLVHPRPVTWTLIIQLIASALDVPVISYDEWLSRLEALSGTEEKFLRITGLHLLEFYRASATPNHVQLVGSREAMGMTSYETKLTVAEAPSLSHVPPLGKEGVNSWIDNWRGKGELQS